MASCPTISSACSSHRIARLGWRGTEPERTTEEVRAMTETTATIRISLERLMRRDHEARHAQHARRRDGGEAGA